MIHYLKQYGIFITEQGVSLDKIGEFVTIFFNTKDFNSIKDVINAGGVVMADISGFSNNDIHNVLIIGYKTNGDLIYMDPEKGYL